MDRRKLAVMILGVAGVLGLASLAQGQEAGWADSLFQEHGIDFGSVPRGSKVRHTFVLTNRLSEPVNILDLRASCGCTTGRSSATLVAPGAQATIEVEMDTRNFVGPKATTMTAVLVTASGKQGEARFTVNTLILPDVVLNPGSADFGAVARGQSAVKQITIERLGKPDWQFTRMIASESLCRVVNANLTQTYRTAQGVGYTLSIALKPEAQPGLLRDEVRLLTNDPETPSVPILITAQVQGSLTASPEILALGRVESTQPAQGRYMIRGTAPFTIQAIEGNGDGFLLTESDKAARALHILELAYAPEQSDSRGDLRRTFRIQTDLPGEPPLEVTATLSVAP